MLTKHHQVISAIQGEVGHEMGLSSIDQACAAQHRRSLTIIVSLGCAEKPGMSVLKQNAVEL